MNKQTLILKYFRVKIRLFAAISKRKAGNLAFKLFCSPLIRTTYDDRIMQNADKLTLPFEKLKIKGYQWNKGGSRKLLILHGFRSASANFKHFANQLVLKNYEVFAFDAPAHGLSDGNILSALGYKNFVTAILQEYGPFDGFVTHSLGGLAISLCLEEIDNNASIQTVLIAPAANSKQICEDFFHQLHIRDAEIKKYFFNKIEQLSGKTIEWFSVNRAANAIKGSVLWIHDLNDNITSATDALALQQKKLPNFEFLFTENLGHRRIYKDEKVVAAVLNFLH